MPYEPDYNEPIRKKIAYLDFLRWRRAVNQGGLFEPALHPCVHELMKREMCRN